MTYSYHETGGAPLKLWDGHGAFEGSAMAQLHNVAKLPFIHKHVAGMPDVHWGMGATVGSVIATKGAIVPAAVGVDIGCGMMAVKTTVAHGATRCRLMPRAAGMHSPVATRRSSPSTRRPRRSTPTTRCPCY